MMRLRKPAIVMDAVCTYHKVTLAQLNTSSQTREIVTVRREMMAMMREFTDLSLARIGQMIGDFDHKTVVNAVARITQHAIHDPDYAERIEQLRRYILDYDPTPNGVAAVNRARHCMTNAPAEMKSEVEELGMVVLMTASVLSSPVLTDAEARCAALQILNRGTRHDTAA